MKSRALPPERRHRSVAAGAWTLGSAWGNVCGQDFAGLPIRAGGVFAPGLVATEAALGLEILHTPATESV